MAKIWIPFALLLLIRGILEPYWISVPRIGGVNEWYVLLLAVRLFPLIAGLLLFWKSRKSIIFLGLVYFLSVSYFAVRLFVVWNRSEVGKYFLPPNSNYYWQIVSEFIQPYLGHLAAGLVTGGVFLFLHLITRGRAMEKNDSWLGVLLGLIHGPLYIVYVVAGGFGLSVIALILGKKKYLQVTPYLLVVSYIMLLTQGWLF